MLLFGHLGITLGTATLAAGVGERFRTKRANPPLPVSGKTSGTPGWAKTIFETVGSWFDALGRKVDIRAVFLGSLLPDLIDKPIGHGLLAGSLNNGRIFGHSLLFFLIVLLAGLLVYRRYFSTFFLAVAFGVIMHLILDSMWADPHVLFWPLYGFAFAKGPPVDFITGILQSVRLESSYVPEIIGFIIVSVFGLWLVRKKAVVRFFRTGRVG